MFCILKSQKVLKFNCGAKKLLKILMVNAKVMLEKVKVAKSMSTGQNDPVYS